ncbi:MAG TPA: nuclear transport factor 2 family protein [Pseudomonadales bacterium]|jgi:hypothetical protein
MNFDDYHAIVRRRYEYALGIDTRDWVLYRSIFTDEITMDFSSYNGRPASGMAADDWVAGCKVLFAGLDATQHVMSNPMVDVDGDIARLRMYMKAEHFLRNDQGGMDFTIGGYYDDRLVRTDEGWKMQAVTLNVFWSRGNRQIMALAAEIGKGKLEEPSSGS